MIPYRMALKSGMELVFHVVGEEQSLFDAATNRRHRWFDGAAFLLHGEMPGKKGHGENLPVVYTLDDLHGLEGRAQVREWERSAFRRWAQETVAQIKAERAERMGLSA